MKDNFDDINTDLLVKYVIGEASAKEELLVREWLETDPSHRRYYDELRLIWEQSRQFSPALSVNEDAAWQRFRSRVSGSRQQTDRGGFLKRLSWMRVAALFIFVVAGTWLAVYLLNSRPGRQLAVRTQETILSDTLPDGSVVTLNKHSHISYPERFTGDTRQVSLTGEAFFAISPDKERPFIIQTNGIRVKVVGTSFNVKNSNGTTEVIVETGIVEVIKKHQSVRLMPREKLTVKKKDTAMTKEVVTDKLYRYYRSKKFVCEATPLYKLVETLNEVYDANITIGRKDLRMLPLTTVFDNEPLENILAIISHTFSISITRSENQIILN